MVTRQVSDPRLGRLISESEASEETRCVGSALLDDLGMDRVRELTNPKTGAIDVELMDDSELDLWVGAVADCDDEGRRLRSLLAVDDSRMADCVTDKILTLDKLGKLLDGLVHGVDVQDTTPVAGFRFSCQTLVIDEMFGPHPPGTMGEDLRLISTFLVSGIFPESDLSAFEDTCLIRGVMSSLPEQVVTKFVDRGGPKGLQSYDLLAEETDPATLAVLLDRFGDAESACIDPFKPIRVGLALGSGPAGAEACLRDGLSAAEQKDIAAILTRTPYHLWYGAQRAFESHREILEDCGVAVFG